MALKKIYIGSVGPFLYDDTDTIDDVDGDFADLTRKGIVTDDQIYISAAPTEDEQVIRKQDLETSILVPVAVANIDDPSTELNTLACGVGTLLLVYEVTADADKFTIYAWDDLNASGEDIPYVVGGSSGFWEAIAGYGKKILNKYIIEAGDNIVIGTNEQTLLIEKCTISGTGSLTINGTGILAILN